MRAIVYLLILCVWICSGALPRTSMWDPKRLAQTKERVKSGDSELKPAVDLLVHEANEFLRFEPVSVTQATKLPPSGDKHDYWSIGTYWWPCNWNTSNIPHGCNTETGVPWVNRDGQWSPYRDPAGDKQKFIDLLNATSALTVAYYFTGNEAYAAKASELIKIWFINSDSKMNPNLDYGQQHPGINNGSQEGIIDFRIVADQDSITNIGGLLNGVELLVGSKSWTQDDDKALQEWFKSYQKWLQSAKIAVAESNATNNHGTWYDVQLGSMAYYVSDFTTLDRLLKAVGIKRIAPQIQPDGSMPQELTRTTSFHYSWFALTAYMDVADIGISRNIDIWNFTTSDHRSIKQALDFLIPYAIGEKAWPYPQIAPFDGDFFPVFRRASIAWHDKYYESLISKLPNHQSSRINLLWPKIF